MPPVTIIAQGTSTIFHQAERAVIFVQVSSSGSWQSEVSKRVTETTNELRAMLKDLSPKTNKGYVTPDAPVTYWKNNTLRISSYIPLNENGSKLCRQYVARTTFEIKFRDLERLGSFATSLFTMLHVTISRIEWHLTEATEASLTSQIRQTAIKDAAAKAKDYAAVLMRGKPEAVEITDQGSGLFGSSAPGYFRTAAQDGGHGHGREPQADVLDFEPESVQLNCTVTVKFVADGDASADTLHPASTAPARIEQGTRKRPRVPNTRYRDSQYEL